jgi:uncharacterized protein YlxP (DUF503 family)
MPTARLTIEVGIEAAHSLKDRRQVVRSLKDKLRHGFNVSVAEMDEGLVYNRATLGIVAISSSQVYLEGQIGEVERALERLCVGLGAEVLDASVDILD